MNEKKPCRFCGILNGSSSEICVECKDFSYKLKDLKLDYILERVLVASKYFADNPERITYFKNFRRKD